MRKLTESLEVNNSSNQTGLAHQTSLYNQQFIEDAVRTAVKLQNHIDKMYKVDFVKELYLDNLVDADFRCHGTCLCRTVKDGGRTMKNEKIDRLIEALTELKAAQKRICELESKIRTLMSDNQSEEAGVLPIIPNVRAETFTTKEIANELGITPQSLNKTLSEKEIIALYGDKWIVTPRFASKGLMCVRISPYIDSSNTKRNRANLLIEWTKEGKDYIMSLFKH